MRSSREEGENISTIKIHQLHCHLIQDIKGGGLVSNYDSQAGESH